MKFSQGFSLVEVVVAMLIGTVISVLLFQSVSQFTKAGRTVDRIATVQTDKALLDRQWDRDFSGMFAPLKKIPVAREDDSEKKEPKTQEQPQEAKSADAKKEQKEEDKFHPDPFVVTTEQNSNAVTVFSCITTNPALMYGHLLPRIVRVVYKVVPDVTKEGHFVITRQQSDDLDLAAFTKKDSKIRAYPLVSNLKKIMLDAWVEKVPKKENAKKKPDAQPAEKQEKKSEEVQPRVFVSWQEWQKVDAEEKKKYEPALVPHFVKLTVTVAEGAQESEQIFWYAPLYDARPILIEGPSGMLTDKQRDGQKQASQQYNKINNDLQDFHERVLSKKPGFGE